ncbi:unnamed protein product, partial [Ectocarpus fasciculatus]
MMRSLNLAVMEHSETASLLSVCRCPAETSTCMPLHRISLLVTSHLRF